MGELLMMNHKRAIIKNRILQLAKTFQINLWFLLYQHIFYEINTIGSNQKLLAQVVWHLGPLTKVRGSVPSMGMELQLEVPLYPKMGED